MNKTDAPGWLKALLRPQALKGFVFYALIPLILLWLLARPIQNAVRAADDAAFWILLAALLAVGLNWGAYFLRRGRRPALLIYGHGVLCLLVVAVIERAALPDYFALSATLDIIIVMLAMAFFLLLSFYLATRSSRPAHAVSVFIRAVLGVILACMAYQIVRDVESRMATRDTWITLAVMLGFIVAFNGRKIAAACRRRAAIRRRSGVAAGRIVQVIGETSLDRDDDLVNRYYACVGYVVDGACYETRADISRYRIRRHGKDALVGLTVPVFFDPADPADAFAERINRHVFDQ